MLPNNIQTILESLEETLSEADDDIDQNTLQEWQVRNALLGIQKLEEHFEGEASDQSQAKEQKMKDGIIQDDEYDTVITYCKRRLSELKQDHL